MLGMKVCRSSHEARRMRAGQVRDQIQLSGRAGRRSAGCCPLRTLGRVQIKIRTQRKNHRLDYQNGGFQAPGKPALRHKDDGNRNRCEPLGRGVEWRPAPASPRNGRAKAVGCDSSQLCSRSEERAKKNAASNRNGTVGSKGITTRRQPPRPTLNRTQNPGPQDSACQATQQFGQ